MSIRFSKCPRSTVPIECQSRHRAFNDQEPTFGKLQICGVLLDEINWIVIGHDLLNGMRRKLR